MSREKIFSASGFLPKKGMHPLIFAMLFIYVVFVLIIILTSDAQHIRIVGPGIIPLVALHFSLKNKPRPIKIFLDRVENNELCLSYRFENKEEETSFYIDEYSYWYYPIKSDNHQVDLFFRIKSVRNEIVLLKEERTTLEHPEKWEMQETKTTGTEITMSLRNLEELAVQMDKYSS